MHVELNVTEGPAKGQHFIFEQPDCFLFGRSADAQISLPEDKHLSRQHFMLEISPPNCRLIDLESKNGVFVNGIRYGGRKPPKPGIKLAPDGAREVWLQDGDEITVGDTRLTISIRQGNTRVDEQTGRHIVTDKAEQSTDTSLVTSLRLPEYHIEREIGRGSTGVMYKATEIKTETPAAIKTVVSQVSIDSQKTRLFQRELDIICQLKHKHIVRLLKHGKAEGIFYFIFEFVDGSDLPKFLQSKGGYIALEEAAPIFLGILDGMAYAHNVRITFQTAGGKQKSFKGIVHQDIKPHNILLERAGEYLTPKISEFGISKGFESSGLTNITTPDNLRTPIYWPREQITHYKCPHPATDVFSLAAVFYEMLTGAWVRKGFRELLNTSQQTGRSLSISDYLNVIVANSTVPIRQRNRDIPKAVAEVLDKALQETEIPQDKKKMRATLKHLRYPDAGAFRAALVDAFEKIGISTSVRSIRQQKPVREARRAVEQLPAGTVVYSMIKPTVKKEVALLVVDLVQSTEYVLDMGDTSFSTLIGNIYRRFNSHALASELIFLKCTGDGFLSVFTTVPAAFAVAQSFLETPLRPDVHVRMALHWGEVKAGPGGDVLGKEVHRVCRVEGVKVENQLEPRLCETPLPPYNRIMLTQAGVTQLDASDQKKFSRAGKFRLKGFSEPCELWVCT